MSNLGIPARSEGFSEWYNELVVKAGLAEHSPVKGCMIIPPNGYAMWELIQRAFDDHFKATGHVNAYFPLLIPKSFLSKEAQHVEGFAKECAVVTHYRLKNDPNGGGVIVDPEAKLEEELIIRPTSETIIWSTYAKWIQSYRDLPLLINQWANVMRWEMRTRLFLRTAEFLWQEGHTAHATAEEAETEAMKMLRVYQKVAEEWLALPVLTGVKSKGETFAGAVHTYCIESLTQEKKAIQAGTSHNLGQNFAKAFDVKFQTADSKLDYVYGTSWGVSTRLIGALVMTHSDDKGLVAPPRVAPVQIAIIPIGREEEVRAKTFAAADEIADALRSQYYAHVPVRVQVDKREKESPGFKYNYWELRGACIRIEIGPRDLEAGTCIIARRDTGEKMTVAISEAASVAFGLLQTIQDALFQRALEMREENTIRVDTWDEFEAAFAGDNAPGFVVAHWDGTAETEDEISKRTKATIRVIPFTPLKPEDATPGACILTGKPSTQRVVFAKAY